MFCTTSTTQRQKVQIEKNTLCTGTEFEYNNLTNRVQKATFSTAQIAQTGFKYILPVEVKAIKHLVTQQLEYQNSYTNFEHLTDWYSTKNMQLSQKTHV